MDIVRLQAHDPEDTVLFSQFLKAAGTSFQKLQWEYNSEKLSCEETLRVLESELKNWKVAACYRSERVHHIIFQNGSSALFAKVSPGSLDILVSGEMPKINLPIPPLEQDEVGTDFWFWTRQGPQSVHRNINCPTWLGIERNYPGLDLGPLMKDPTDENGRVILWYGVPGTGKTYAVRALLREWKEKFRSVVITDPENFFGEMSYAYRVLLSDSDLATLVILEDAAEFVMADQRGPGVARLLNLADGLIGQGVRVVFLLTTNEEVGKIDPALKRPGRCRQVLSFPSFTSAQVAEWLNKEVIPGRRREEQTLAELYNQKREGSERIGF